MAWLERLWLFDLMRDFNVTVVDVNPKLAKKYENFQIDFIHADLGSEDIVKHW